MNIHEDIKTICKPLETFGLTTFANARVNHLGQFSTINNHPEYADHYIQQGFYNADIYTDAAQLEDGNYLMWDLVDCGVKTREMLDAAIAFRYKHIFTIVKNQETHTVFYHFGTHISNPAINHLYLNDLDKLELFIDYFNEKIIFTGLDAAHEVVFPTQPIKANILKEHAAANDANDSFVSTLMQSQYSPRQLECMKLIVQGQSAKEIAKTLNISHRTVEDYIQTLKYKFSAKNKKEVLSCHQKILNSNTLEEIERYQENHSDFQEIRPDMLRNITEVLLKKRIFATFLADFIQEMIDDISDLLSISNHLVIFQRSTASLAQGLFREVSYIKASPVKVTAGIIVLLKASLVY